LPAPIARSASRPGSRQRRRTASSRCCSTASTKRSRKPRHALRQGDIEAKCKAIGRAVRIVDEGLKAALDVEAGGPLASDLSVLYGYVAVRLTEANLHNDRPGARRVRRAARAGARRLDRDRPRGGGRRRSAVNAYRTEPSGARMNSVLLNYYQAIEQASQDMLEAARGGKWDEVVKLEGACAVLIAQLKSTAASTRCRPTRRS
jgi:hypothetical protein